METLTIDPLRAVGPLRFGAMSGEVGAVLGAPDRTFAIDSAGSLCEVRETSAISSCDFEQGRLTALTINHAIVDAVMLGEVELLRVPLDEVLSRLDQMNGGTEQIQGGSLCYEALGLMLRQFEAPGARELLVTSSSIRASEPTRSVGLQEALDYYRAQTGREPKTDWFGRLP
ncbi:hypothetical protein V8J82_20270 [Gymnodinialimonas sp. 2305UL16-5]|uniref:hypothetical protein n=1 Tax=Gymnodinialimonas mytili TaxID=3126503 RepID=UPI0030AD560F